ncbi:hypothetical protein MRB53_041321 [Persea americana]|nr:hypothetical protein MRB53_041321 [Persea americana]
MHLAAPACARHASSTPRAGFDRRDAGVRSFDGTGNTLVQLARAVYGRNAVNTRFWWRGASITHWPEVLLGSRWTCRAERSRHYITDGVGEEGGVGLRSTTYRSCLSLSRVCRSSTQDEHAGHLIVERIARVAGQTGHELEEAEQITNPGGQTVSQRLSKQLSSYSSHRIQYVHSGARRVGRGLAENFHLRSIKSIRSVISASNHARHPPRHPQRQRPAVLRIPHPPPLPTTPSPAPFRAHL